MSMWCVCPSAPKAFVAGIVAVSLLPHSATGQSVRGDSLPAIAFHLELNAPMVSDRLGPAKATAFQSILEDSVRRIFQSRFRYLRWVSQAKDSLIVRVTEPGLKDDRNLRLRILLNGGTRILSDTLEMYSAVHTRDFRTLRIEDLRDQWCALADSIILKKAQYLVEQLFGTLRIRADVELRREDLQAVVHLRPQTIKITSDDVSPGFRLNFEVSESLAGLAAPLGGKIDLDLFACKLSPNFFLCDIGRVEYPKGTVIDEGKRLALLRRVTVLGTISLYVRQYSIEAASGLAPPSVAASGLAPPGVATSGTVRK